MKDSIKENFKSDKPNLMLANANSQELDIQLWNSFRLGNREALDNIFEKYVRVLFTYGRNLTCDQDLISDCIQDLFTELWIKREKLVVHVNSIKYYLVKSIRRRILRRISSDRHIIGRQPIPDDYYDEVEFNIEFNIIRDQTSTEISHQLKTSVASLSKGQQEAIYLKFYENLTYQEVASVMKTNVKSVYNLINRSVSSLRKSFKAHPIQK